MPRAGTARTLRLLLHVALLSFASCSFGPVTASHRFTNAMPEPGGHRFAVVILSTESREPTAFLSRFPDRGRPKILAERMGLWLCDADRGTAARLATLLRPVEIQSGFTAWIVGWDPPGGESAGVYVEVSGHRGATSDTPVLRWMLRFSVDPEPGSNAAVLFLPNEALRPRAQGPLKGGREIQVSLGADTIAVRADTRPEWVPLFLADRRSGAVALLQGAAPLGAPPEPHAARAAREPQSEGLMAINPRAAAPSGPRAAPAIWCDSVQLFLRQFASSPIRRGNDPYVDPLAVRPLPACSVELTAPWERVDPRRTPWESLGAWLSTQGFARDPRYDGNDPDSRAALYRRGDRFCAYAASWWAERPGPGAPAADKPGTGRRPAEQEVGDPDQGPPTRYRLAVWSGVSR